MSSLNSYILPNLICQMFTFIQNLYYIFQCTVYKVVIIIIREYNNIKRSHVWKFFNDEPCNNDILGVRFYRETQNVGKEE